ncbi:hypothetical protein [Aliifodinibius salipaludis]|uniref:hypothetical protein n=1 Tax=Fodinibius salipaludis TaxID=2032627 RepID=UPI0020D08FFE|nr:hypothetical protein [Aliifodinibius salipaludis]
MSKTTDISIKKIYIALRSGPFLTILAIIAWVVGEPFIFQSLGPTAYVMAFRSESKYTVKTIIGGHACGVAGGLLRYHLMVSTKLPEYDGRRNAGVRLLAGLWCRISARHYRTAYANFRSKSSTRIRHYAHRFIGDFTGLATGGFYYDCCKYDVSKLSIVL